MKSAVIVLGMVYPSIATASSGPTDRAVTEALGRPYAQDLQTDELDRQRDAVLRYCSIALTATGGLWSLWTLLVWFGWADGSRHGLAIDLVPPAILTSLGALALRLRSTGSPRASAYSLILAIAGNAHFSLIFHTDTALTAVVAYCVALCIAAVVMRPREMLWIGSALIGTTLVAVVLHHHPVVTQADLPPAVATMATLLALLFGLPFPMVMFWLFTRNLQISRAAAWREADVAARAMEEVERSRKELAFLAERLQEKNTELGDFLYVVSHDMRAPLINLEGFSRAIQEGLGELVSLLAEQQIPPAVASRISELTRDLEESLDFVLRSVARADFLVNTVLELSRLETRKERSGEIELTDLVREIVASLQYRLNELGARIDVGPLPAIHGDPIRVHQIFANLLDNALKYIRSDEPPVIDVRCTVHDDGYLFSVRDNGVGIRREDVTKAFRMFGRLGHGGYAGDGIGLTMVRKIIERHNGRIWVESTPGEGSTFFFTWPTAPIGGTNEEEAENAAA